MPPSDATKSDEPARGRRLFLERAASFAMGGGLIAGYGSCAAVAARYVYPADERRVRLFVTDIAAIAVGQSIPFVTPAGVRLSVTRSGAGTTAGDFMALSSTCPHLGCKVFWEGDKQRYFCPCHNGTFDPNGNPTGGPPLASNSPLIRYPLVVEGPLLFIELPAREA